MMQYRKHIFAAVVLVFSAATAAQKPLRFECSGLFTIWNDKVVEAYANLGIDAECVSLPLARGASEVASGNLDGSIIRAIEFGEQFPGLLRVEPPVTVFTILLYKRKNDTIDYSNWRSHTVVSLRGSVLSDHLLAGLDVYRAASAEAALKQLSAGRVDLLLGDAVAIPKALQALGMSNIEPIYPPLATYPMYHYLTPEHRQLVAPISEQLSQMAKP